MYSRAQNSVVGPQGSAMNAHHGSGGGGGGGGSTPKMEWVLYVDPKDALCASALQSIQHVDRSFIYPQDVNAIERSQRPTWLTGVPALVSIRDQMVYRGTQAMQTLQKLLESMPNHNGGGGGTTLLSDVMMVDDRQPRAQSHGHGGYNGGGGGQQPLARQQQQPNPSGPGAAAAPGSGAGQFGSVNDPLDSTMLADGNDSRYEERGKGITSSQIESYSSRRKNYAGASAQPQM